MWYDIDMARALLPVGFAGPCREEKGDVHTNAGYQTPYPPCAQTWCHARA
jgi:hypothetical protein